MEFEKGMYVRTNKGIAQIVMPDRLVYMVKTDIYDYVPKCRISKTSYNIIDLIEVGDYVNGYEVTSKDQFLGIGNHDWYIAEYEIKSIVTKEQFESMKYKVEDE